MSVSLQDEKRQVITGNYWVLLVTSFLHLHYKSSQIFYMSWSSILFCHGLVLQKESAKLREFVLDDLILLYCYFLVTYCITMILLLQFWNDEFLRWNPDAHSGIKRVRISPDRLWLPDIALLNEWVHILHNLHCRIY